MYRQILFVTSILSCALLGARSTWAEAVDTVEPGLFAPAPPVSGSTLSHLATGDFDALTTEFEKAESAFLQGELDEAALIDQWKAFRNSDPAIAGKLGSWIEAEPDSYVPYTARGVYLVHLGWIARGTSLAKNVRPEQWKLMSAYFSMAMRDFEDALARNSKLSIAYGLLIEIEMTRGGEVSRYYERGVEAVPQSAYLRSTYRHALRPEWFGAGTGVEDAMRLVEVARWKLDSNRAARTWPAVGVPPGSETFNEGLTLQFRGAHEAAVAKYDAAIEASPSPYYFLQRGKARYRLEQYDEAEADFQHVAQAMPESAEVHAELGWVDAVRGNWTDAVEHWRRAVDLDPYHPKFLRYFGMGLDRSAGAFVTEKTPDSSVAETPSAARCLGDDVDPFEGKTFRIEARSSEMWRYHCGVMTVLDRALVHGANDPELRRMRGEQLMVLLGRPDRAVAEYTHLVELEGDNAQNWKLLGQSLYEAGSCKAVAALIQYLTIHEARPSEADTDLVSPTMVKLWLADIAKNGECGPRIAAAAAQYKPQWLK